MKEKIKIKVAEFVADILENDALRFFFTKNNKSNKNALLNKLIPILVETRKARRNELENILKNEYCREDQERIYSAANTVIDRVYFNGAELDNLDEYIWIRPTKNSIVVFNEILTSETIITAQEPSVYIRGLLNEYSRLPQYKRELLTFDKEIDVYSEACHTQQIVHFTDKVTNKKHKVFAYNYCFGHLFDQNNYCILYDIEEKIITAFPLRKIKDIYTIKQKFNPNEQLLQQLDKFCYGYNYTEDVIVEDNKDVL